MAFYQWNAFDIVRKARTQREQQPSVARSAASENRGGCWGSHRSRGAPLEHRDLAVTARSGPATWPGASRATEGASCRVEDV